MKRVLLAVSVLAWTAFIIYSVRRLGRRPANQRERTIFIAGVRFFGLSLWAAFICMPFLLDWPDRWRLAGCLAFLTLPLCLWGGWIWGSAMAWVFGMPRS